MNRFYTALFGIAVAVACVCPSWAASVRPPVGALKVKVLPAEAHATVTVIAAPELHPVWRLTQGQSGGIYLFEGLPAGGYQVVAESRRYIGDWRPQVNVKPSQTTEVTFSLGLGAVISGTITPSGRRILVMVQSTAGSWSFAFADPKTGHYEVTGLRPGEYDLAFASPQGEAIRGLPPLPPNTMTEASGKALAELAHHWAASRSDGATAADRLRPYSRSFRDGDITYDKLAAIAQKSDEREAKAKAAGRPPRPTADRTLLEIVRVGGDDTRAVVLVHGRWKEVRRSSEEVVSSTEYDEVALLQREAGEWKIVVLRGGGVAPAAQAKHVSHLFSDKIAGIRVAAGQESTGHDLTLPADWSKPLTGPGGPQGEDVREAAPGKP
jgi:hypothetical protein